MWVFAECQGLFGHIVQEKAQFDEIDFLSVLHSLYLFFIVLISFKQPLQRMFCFVYLRRAFDAVPVLLTH